MMNKYAISKLKKIRLMFMPQEFNIASAMAIRLKQLELGKSMIWAVKVEIYSYLKNALIEQIYYNKKQTSSADFLLFYGKGFYRRDHYLVFKNFSNVFRDADVICAEKMKHIRIHPIRLFCAIWKGIIWWFQMIFKGISPFIALVSIPYIQLCIDVCNEMKNLNLEKYRFMVLYYDLTPDENIAAQYFHKHSITTMTLQHGIFSKKKNMHNVSDTGIEFTGSISDYYLAWNKYTYDQAVRAGMKAENIRILGMPRYISSEHIKCKAANTNVFGVVLNSADCDKHNKMLVKMAEKIAVLLKKEYVLRYHPGLAGDEYRKLCGKYFRGKSSNSFTIAEFAASVEFTLISASSVFIDLIMLKHPVYRLVISEDDNYSEVAYHAFHTTDQFMELYNTKSVNGDTSYLVTENIYNNYRNFFDSYKKLNEN